MASGCCREGLTMGEGFAFGLGLALAGKAVNYVFGPWDVKIVEVPSSRETLATAAGLVLGTNSPGTTVPRSNSPGTNIPRSNSPGTNIPGTNIPGSNSPGTNIPGSNSPGSHCPGVSNACDDQFKALNNCLYSNKSEIGRCQPYWDKLQECRLCSVDCPQCLKEYPL